MPTITLSWTDLALFGLTAGFIGSMVLIGRSNSLSSTQTVALDEKNSTTSKKKKNRNKKRDIIVSTLPASSINNQANDLTKPSSPSPPTNPSKTILKISPNQTQSPQVISVDPKFQADFPPLSTSNKNQNNKHDINRQQRPFAERHKKPVRKTIVDDMIDEDVEKPLTISRVMNIVNPKPQPQVPLSPISDPEEGWEKVPDSKLKGSRNTDNSMAIGSARLNQTPSTISQTSEQKQSKRQRQNAKKKEVAKANKAVEEAERLHQLALHKRDQERLKINSSVNTSKKSTNNSTSGGMKSTIGEDGRLIWQ